MEEWLTPSEAAQELGISTSRVRQLIMSGQLPAIKRGNTNFIKPDDLEKVRNRGNPGYPKGRPRKSQRA